MKKCPNCNEPVFKNIDTIFMGNSPKICSNCGAKITTPRKYTVIHGLIFIIIALTIMEIVPFHIFIFVLIALYAIDLTIFIKYTPLIVN
ncbi:MAG: hypothetical protein JJE17_11215 [Peptostreptococcaceae bacterium]|nr:hypothetical protein [Peptostreptococcaceae bacterium]